MDRPTRRSITNCISVDTSVFCIAQLAAESPYTLQRSVIFFLKIVSLREDPEFQVPSNTRFLGPNRVHPSNGISIGSAVFAELTIVTDRQRYFVYNNRSYGCVVQR